MKINTILKANLEPEIKSSVHDSLNLWTGPMVRIRVLLCMLHRLPTPSCFVTPFRSSQSCRFVARTATRANWCDPFCRVTHSPILCWLHPFFVGIKGAARKSGRGRATFWVTNSGGAGRGRIRSIDMTGRHA